MPKIMKSQINELQKWVNKRGGVLKAAAVLRCSYERIYSRLRGIQPMSRQLAEDIRKNDPGVDIVKLLGYK